MSREKFALLGEIVSRRPLVVACVAGFAAFLLAAGYLSSREEDILSLAEPLDVVVASHDIAAGEMIDDGMIQVVPIPRRFVQPGAISKIIDTAGRVAAIPIRAGTQITPASARRPSEIRSIAGLVPAGRRAFSISLDDTPGISKLLKPDDTVDVLATFDLGHESSVRRTTIAVVEGTQVLATGTEIADSLPDPPRESKGKIFGNSSPYQMGAQRSTVTLAVTPAEAQSLAFAQVSGVLAIALRPFADDSGAEKTLPTTIATITGGHDELLPMRGGYREYKGR